MSFRFFLVFLIFIFQIAIAVAEEQTVAVQADVSDSFVSAGVQWLYSGAVKEKVIGVVVTLITILVGLGAYYLVKLF